MIPRGPELWRQILESRMLDLHTAMVCEVVSFDAAAQTANVQPLVKHVIRSTNGPDFQEDYPQLLNVPVVYPRCGKFFVAFPLEVGDFVTVVFNEWSIDRFIEKGTGGHPGDLARHSLAGAVAYPGGPFPKTAPITEDLDGLVIGNDGGAVIRITEAGMISLGATAGTKQPIALADDVKDQLDGIKADLDLIKVHVHPTAAPGPPSVSPGLAGMTYAPATVGSSIAEVEE